jgi:hypothetical protein
MPAMCLWVSGCDACLPCIWSEGTFRRIVRTVTKNVNRVGKTVNRST